ncbi:isocitrate dehydrogenase [NADP] [Tistrella bauzanensis]|uniref:Isocitrate dehydrogenase [NADP] n=1 Tax=Tistrella bauzanensis TaxID=657419 RepID=A0ABQ1IYS8_9PROT|nr:isocitrate/isopropylmalate family dehydrogenase [Tistrella bauzanensis]GGB54484.1 isocitrate dehydrogenase [NADP] [Tistrella bauzanensis]
MSPVTTEPVKPASPARPVTHSVVLIEGDGIGPEISAAVRLILDAAAAPIAWQPAVAGGRAFAAGVGTGVPADTVALIEQTRLVLKAPLETPVGHGGKSANVTLRKLFEMYANIRPVKELPGVTTPFSGRGIDLVIVRENVEDLYAGIEHMQTPDTAQALKLITRRGSAKIARAAFELARREGRGRVTAVHKANILKLTEGLFKRTVEAVARDYPDINADDMIVDACAHKLVVAPEQIDVAVMTNMNGDILSDLAAGLVGGLGLAASANIGDHAAMFEAVHGSAPDIAGRGLANPTAFLQAALMLLRHLGETEQAMRIEAALALTLTEGRVLTGDLARGRGVAPSSTMAFAEAVAANLARIDMSELPVVTPAATPDAPAPRPLPGRPAPLPDRLVVETRADTGFDLFFEVEDGDPAALGAELTALAEATPFRLKHLSNRGTAVWPGDAARTELTPHWRARFLCRSDAAAPHETDQGFDDAAALALIGQIGRRYRWMHVEKLAAFNGADAFSRDQGEA